MYLYKKRGTAQQGSRSFSYNSTVKQTVRQSLMCKNIHTTFNVLCFTPALSKIHNACSYPIISLWISTNQSRLCSFSRRHGNWLYCGVTVWNLAGETLINLYSAVSWRWTGYWGSCNTKNWIHHNSRLVCEWVRIYSLREF